MGVKRRLTRPHRRNLFLIGYHRLIVQFYRDENQHWLCQIQIVSCDKIHILERHRATDQPDDHDHSLQS